MSKIHPRRLGAALAGTIAALALMGGSSAIASTLTMSGSTLTYDSTASGNTDVSFAQAGSSTPDTVTVSRAPGDDTDPITAVPANCTANTAGASYDCAGVGAVVANAGSGNAVLDATNLQSIPATLNGGAGSDSLYGGAAADTLSGGGGDDDLVGAGGNDVLHGGAGDDFLDGGAGTDQVTGDEGDDVIQAAQSHVINPPAGEPAQEQDTGDSYSGGDGLDSLYFSATTRDEHATSDTSDDTFTPLNKSITLDDVANDGIAGQNANAHSDIEVVNIDGGTNTLTGSAAANQLVGGEGNDTIDGGAGNDFLNGHGGDDTINARDGYADFVTCGPGTDVANVDSLDTVSSDCETVNRTDVGNASDDRPPTITLTGATNGQTLSTKRPTTLTANVSDDKGVSSVLFTVNGRLVCTATKAPYTCAYQPQGSDVGRSAIVASAVDTAQQTATAQQSVTIPRFDPHKFTAYVSPRHRRSMPMKFTAKGRITLPSTVTAAQGCGIGVVTVQIKAGKQTISTRRATIKKDCTYASSVTFHKRSRFAGQKRLRYFIRFGGNAVLRHSGTRHYSVGTTY